MVSGSGLRAEGENSAEFFWEGGSANLWCSNESVRSCGQIQTHAFACLARSALKLGSGSCSLVKDLYL